MWEALNDLYYGLKVLRTKMTQLKLINCLIGEALKDFYYGLKGVKSSAELGKRWRKRNYSGSVYLLHHLTSNFARFFFQNSPLSLVTFYK